MAQTKIRGNTQIKDGTIESAQLAGGAGSLWSISGTTLTLTSGGTEVWGSDAGVSSGITVVVNGTLVVLG